ncbi:hypothetical protein ID875_00510 [Streptomyces globisporus]|uniref:Uncharacterized protein n=1 Tax=Streptomyces globisporus TaxID=1908 RepID=A0A927GLG9_STRGL|nr:hypothetical protein [Streptomyces globisporus]
MGQPGRRPGAGRVRAGQALHEDHPAHRALRAALTEAYALLPNIPPGGQAKARGFFDAAHRALAVLADPAQTPPVMRWYAEVVAMDGARVLLDRVMVIRHRDAQDLPVGTSSLPLHAWQDGLRQHYGLLPQVTGYTRCGGARRRSKARCGPCRSRTATWSGCAAAPAARSSPWPTAPTPRSTTPASWTSCTPWTATSPRSPRTAGRRDGRRPRGPAAFDPLDTPVAGQQLANGLDRWIWTPGGGAEAFLVPADQLGGVRWQLAEGDWWAGFRPSRRPPNSAAGPSGSPATAAGPRTYAAGSARSGWSTAPCWRTTPPPSRRCCAASGPWSTPAPPTG